MNQKTYESIELYETLLEKTFEVCASILSQSRPTTDPSAIRIWDAAQEFLSSGPIVRSTKRRPGAYAAFEALDQLLADWPKLRNGEISGEEAYARAEGLWERLMCEPPMGTYAEITAELVNHYAKPGDSIVELGAGVGNTSRLLKLPANVSYIRTDINPFLLRMANLPGEPLRYNFDQACSFRDVDIVFAVNALHCAQNPRLTLQFIHDMLDENGGSLILTEGEPISTKLRPWALDVLFCQFKGWWDRTGFRTRSVWMDDLRAVGFRELEFKQLLAGEHDLGGIILARR